MTEVDPDGLRAATAAWRRLAVEAAALAAAAAAQADPGDDVDADLAAGVGELRAALASAFDEAAGWCDALAASVGAAAATYSRTEARVLSAFRGPAS